MKPIPIEFMSGPGPHYGELLEFSTNYEELQDGVGQYPVAIVQRGNLVEQVHDFTSFRIVRTSEPSPDIDGPENIVLSEFGRS